MVFYVLVECIYCKKGQATIHNSAERFEVIVIRISVLKYCSTNELPNQRRSILWHLITEYIIVLQQNISSSL